MKFFTSTLLFALFAHGISASDSGTPVELKVKCSGLDMNNLEPVSIAIVGQILEESYNAFHDKQSNGSSLKVSTNDSRWRCGSLCPDDDAIVIKKSSTSNFVGRWRCGSLCPDDDAVVGVSAGRWRCGSLCPDDDSVVVGVSGDTYNDFSSWEDKFVMGLISTRRHAFRAVENCSITMK